MNTQIVRKCAQCTSELIVTSSVTERLEGSLFPQTTVKYKCSNVECMERIDKETEKRLKLKKEKEVADKRRIADRINKRA